MPKLKNTDLENTHRITLGKLWLRHQIECQSRNNGILTTFNLQIACLSVMRVVFKVHRTREHKCKPEIEDKSRDSSGYNTSIFKDIKKVSLELL